MRDRTDLLQGTLDLLVLKSLSLAPLQVVGGREPRLAGPDDDDVGPEADTRRAPARRRWFRRTGGRGHTWNLPVGGAAGTDVARARPARRLP